MKSDVNNIKSRDRQSLGPGLYSLERPGIVQCRSNDEYISLVDSNPLNIAAYRSACKIDKETKLLHSKLTNMREIHQLYPRTHHGPSKVPGTRTLENVDIENSIIYGRWDPSFRSTDPMSGAIIDRFQYLYDFRNPQNAMAKAKRIGVSTRDQVRHIDFEYKNI